MSCQLFPLQQEVGSVLSQTLPSSLLITLHEKVHNANNQRR
jgi:hypothetical protein